MSCCKGCEKRSKAGEPNCHEYCEEYKAFRALKDRENAEAHRRAEADDYQITLTLDLKDYIRKGTKQHHVKRRRY